ncbi:MAG: ABC transporter permease [Trebonia sp.]
MHVLKFMVKRAALGVLMVVATSFLGFLLMSALTGNVALNILGPNASKAQLAAENVELGLNKPVLERYFTWAGHALQGNFGNSWFSAQSVTDAISTRLPVTVSLVAGTIVISLVLSVAIGLWAGVRRGTADRVVQAASIAGFIVPPFLLALGLVLVFAVGLHWLPPTGYVALNVSPEEWAKSLALPVVSLTFGVTAAVAQQVRRSVIDVMDMEYVRTLRSRGLSEWRVLCVHVLKNAGAIGVQVLALQAIALLGGAVIAEQIFAMPGIGSWAVSSAPQGDVPAVMGIFVVFALIVFSLNLLADFIIALLNPKVTLV